MTNTRTDRTELDTLLRAADPVTAADIDAWTAAGRPMELMQAVLTEAAPADAIATASPRITAGPHAGAGAFGRSRSGSSARRTRRVVIVAFAAVLLTAGTAAARALLFGDPAPDQVKRDLAGVDAGYPADLRLNPDVAHARSVAATGASTLYVASLKDGGTCTELVAAGRPNGAVCATAGEQHTVPLEVTVPFTDPVTDSSPVTLAGRVNVAGATTLRITYADGTTDDIPFGDDSYFVFDVPSEHLESTHHGDFTLIAADTSGRTVAETVVPAVASDDFEAHDRLQPIFVSTISDGNDLTKVLGVEGSVGVAGAASLELRYPDGTVVQIPLKPDGTYRLDIPAQRQGDLFPKLGLMVVRDADGHVLATHPVGAVAAWRAAAP